MIHIESSIALPLFISNVVTLMLIVFFGRDRYQQEQAYKIQLSRLQTKALIAQMNPHFIYNALNGIQSTLMLKGEEEANEYVTIFSRLIRKTFNMTALQTISLAEEIDYLKSYISLQEKRLSYPIYTSFYISEHLDKNSSEIPALMVQPLIENAILHGIRPLKKAGELQVNFTDDKTTLIVEILDNGVGRKNSKNFRKKEIEIRELPTATKILQDRIDIYNYVDIAKSEFRLEDRISNGKVIGTRAILILPKLIKIKAL